MTRPTRVPPRSLARDNGGAIMVMGVFMAALMIGFIYYVKGIGDAIGFRERMQDAADSGAFASAAVHARGMNLIALINISMVAVLAVATGTRMVAVIAGFVLISGSGGGAPAGLEAIFEQARGYNTTIVRPMFSALRASNTAANAVAVAIPLAAEARGIDAAGGAFRPTVETAFAYPGFARMPVVNSTVGDMTARAGNVAMPLALRPFPPYPEAQRYIHEVRGLPLLRIDAIEASRGIMAEIENPTVLSGMMPQEVSPTAALGNERFQLRVVTGGSFDFALPEQGVEVASWGQTEALGDQERDLALMSRISMAQAEYYFDGRADRDEWLWNQKWRARMRRVRVGAPSGYPCLDPSVYCDALDQMFQRGLEGAVVH
jgi:hypothetical protein